MLTKVATNRVMFVNCVTVTKTIRCVLILSMYCCFDIIQLIAVLILSRLLLFMFIMPARVRWCLQDV